MVDANNDFEYTGFAVFDSYLDNLFAYRTNSQTALLPIIDYLVGKKDETPTKEIVLPQCILGSERAYLTYLQKKYHKRPISFSVSDTCNHDSDTLDTITKLIRKTRTHVDHAILDIRALFFHRPEFEEYTLTLPFKKVITEIAEQYHHTIPEHLTHTTSRNNQEKYEGLFKKALPYALQTLDQQPSEIENVYKTMYGTLKKHVIDFEVLSFYDYLCESDEVQIESDALVEIEPSLITIGQRDYAKLPLTTVFVPSSDKNKQQINHVIINEWASTIRKALEVRDSIASDYRQLYSARHS